ncbi:MAG: hypothetical protein JJ863_02550 [Deltaproteobacteria bacterium]|nr:hypothetical protein [Deltaproteobacteria bacterium]
MSGPIEASLRGSPWASRAAAVVSALREAAIDATRLEASVRGDASGSAQGGRMMIERVRPSEARALIAALGLALEADDEALCEWADANDQPMIVGWDVGRDPPVAKLYVNASDASEAKRRSLGAALGLAHAPHVVGVNLGSRRETKVYEQQAEPPTDVPEALAAWAKDAAVAGWVISLDAPALTRRAVFAALQPTEGAPELRTLPGWSEAAVAALPFPIGFAKSVGYDTNGRWVAYVKPAGATPAAHDLEPVVVLRSPSGEIGIFVEPLGARAYLEVGAHALSYRLREGDPDRDAIDAAMQWAAGEVQRTTPSWDSPPEPWERIDG